MGFLEETQVAYSIRMIDDVNMLSPPIQRLEMDMTSTIIETHVGIGKKHVYVCPRNIPAHRGTPGSCGKECAR